MIEELTGVRDACEEPESIVLQHVYTLMVRSQVVNLFPVDQCPEICADEFHSVQFVLESGPVTGEAFDYPVSGGVADVLQVGQVIFLGDREYLNVN